MKWHEIEDALAEGKFGVNDLPPEAQAYFQADRANRDDIRGVRDPNVCDGLVGDNVKVAEALQRCRQRIAPFDPERTYFRQKYAIIY